MNLIRMKKLITITMIMGFAGYCTAQLDIQYSQFMFNKLSFNPAVAGSKEVPVLQAVYRHQWEGIEGAPKTFNLNFHTPFMRKRGGFGLALTADQIGIVQSYFVDLNYAYRLELAKESNLSFGIRYRQEFSRIDWPEVTVIDVDDESIPSSALSVSEPNFGFGIYFQNKNYYVGVSAPNLLKNNLFEGVLITPGDPSARRSYYFMGGFAMDLSENVMFKPSAMLTLNTHAPYELDMNVSFLFLKSLWLGASYRLGDSVDALVGYQLGQRFRIAASYDFTLTDLNAFTAGSGEIMLEYCFNKERNRLYNLRFF